MPFLKKKHLILLPLLFFTLLLFSMRHEEPVLSHGYILVSTPAGEKNPAAQISFHTLQQDDADTLEIGPSSLYRSCTFITQVDPDNRIDAGLALLNPSSEPATVNIRLVDNQGRLVREVPGITIAGYHKTARLLSEWLRQGKSGRFSGQVILSSDRPVSVLGLETANGMIRNIPVICPGEKTVADDRQNSFFPHFATGGGYRCSLVLWNPYPTPLTCSVQFYDANGKPADVSVSGMQFYSLHLQLQPGQSKEISLDSVQR